MSWFDGDPPRNDADAAFLAALPVEAAGWHLDVRPEQTGVLTALVPLYVDVEVPGSRTARTRTPSYRAVERAEWIGADGKVLAAEWRLKDTGRRLASQGSWLRKGTHPPN